MPRCLADDMTNRPIRYCFSLSPPVLASEPGSKVAFLVALSFSTSSLATSRRCRPNAPSTLCGRSAILPAMSSAMVPQSTFRLPT